MQRSCSHPQIPQVESIVLFALKLLETKGAPFWARLFSSVFLQWIKFPSWNTAEETQKWDCPNMFTFLKTIISMCLKKKSMCTFLKTSDFVPLDIPLSSLSENITELLLLSNKNWFISSNFSAWKSGLLTVSCLHIPKCTLFMQISGVNQTTFQRLIFSMTDSSNNYLWRSEF